jgi:hypothetical protein
MSAPPPKKNCLQHEPFHLIKEVQGLIRKRVLKNIRKTIFRNSWRSSCGLNHTIEKVDMEVKLLNFNLGTRRR